MFEIADYNDNGFLYKQEFNQAMKKLLKSGKVPGDESFLKDVYKRADKSDGKDGIVTFDSLLAAFTKELGEAEAEEEDVVEVAGEEEGGAEEADDGPRCFIDPVFSED